MKQLNLNLSTEALTDLDRTIGMQCANSFAEHFNLPLDREHLAPLALAFCNGVSFARKYDTPQKREELQKMFQPLVDELFLPLNKFES